ncbi:hypothetical protein TMatcc_008777 [Talaromyces marneffei ATCC 18224]
MRSLFPSSEEYDDPRMKQKRRRSPQFAEYYFVIKGLVDASGFLSARKLLRQIVHSKKCVWHHKDSR